MASGCGLWREFQVSPACADDRDPDNRDKNGRLAVECIFVLTLQEKLHFMKAVSKLTPLRATQLMYKAVVTATEEEQTDAAGA